MPSTSVLISPPKAGTHLFGFLTNARRWIVSLRPEPAGGPLTMFQSDSTILDRMENLARGINYKGHIPYSPAIAEKIAQFDSIILLLRDPRDMIVSLAHAIDRHGGEPLDYLAPGGRLSSLAFTDRIDYLIENIRPVFERFDRWRQVDNVKIFYYDAFMILPQSTYYRLANLGYGRYLNIKARAKQKAYTYRRANPGGWLEDMTIEQAGRCRQLFGDITQAWNPTLVNNKFDV